MRPARIYPLRTQARGLSPRELAGLTPFDLSLLLAIREFERGRG